MTAILLRDEFIEHLLDHKRRFPEKNWPLEMRDRWLVALPTVIEDCDIDRVLVVRGEHPMGLIRKT